MAFPHLCDSLHCTVHACVHLFANQGVLKHVAILPYEHVVYVLTLLRKHRMQI